VGLYAIRFRWASCHSGSHRDGSELAPSCAMVGLRCAGSAAREDVSLNPGAQFLVLAQTFATEVSPLLRN
jgi:hypothetical protein